MSKVTLEGLGLGADDLAAIGKLSESGMTPNEIADAVEKAHSITSSASEIDENIYSHPQLTEFLYNLNNPNRNMSILVNSDSTGDSDTEFVYLFAQWIGANFNINVRFRYWDNVAKAYAASISITTGKTYTLDFFNFAVGGSTVYYIQNVDNAQKAYKEITNKLIYPNINNNLDLIIMNHGHNLDETNMGKKGIGLMFAQVVEELSLFHPSAGIVVVKQTPNTLLSNESKIRQITSYAIKRGFCVLDFWKKFMDLGMAASLYKDFQHPSDLGNIELLSVMTNIFNKQPNLLKTSYSKSLLSTIGINYLANGNFTTWTNTAMPPDGYAVSGGTAIKDITKYDSPKGYSVKFTATGTSAYFGINSLTSGFDHLKGKSVILAVRMFVDASTSLNVGNIGVTTDNTTLVSTAQSSSNGSWVWRFHPLNIGINDSILRARVYLDGGSGTSIFIDRMILCLGDLPYDSNS